MGFKTLPLRDCITLCIDHRGKTPTKLGGKWSEAGYRALSAKNIKTGTIVQQDAIRFVDEDLYRKWMPDEIERGDILVTSEAPFGQVYIWDSDEKIVLSQRLFGVRPNKDICDPHYLYYWMCGQQFQGDMRGRATGTTVIGLRQPALLSCEVILPDLNTQQQIVSILQCLDNKIAINRRTNDYLESLIEAMLSRILIDEDAKDVSLGDYLYIKGRIGWKGLKKSEYLPISDYRIINGESLTLAGINWEKAGYISKERYEESPEIMLQPADILLSKDGTIGKIGYVDELETPTSVASGIFVIRNTRKEELSTHFIYYLLKSHMFKAFVAGRTEGSVIPHLYQKDFVEFRFPLPDKNKMRAFEDATRPMFEQVIYNTRENKKLVELRDALLPKLMSGEIDVSKIELLTTPNNHL